MTRYLRNGENLLSVQECYPLMLDFPSPPFLPPWFIEVYILPTVAGRCGWLKRIQLFQVGGDHLILLWCTICGALFTCKPCKSFHFWDAVPDLKCIRIWPPNMITIPPLPRYLGVSQSNNTIWSEDRRGVFVNKVLFQQTVPADLFVDLGVYIVIGYHFVSAEWFFLLSGYSRWLDVGNCCGNHSHYNAFLSGKPSRKKMHVLELSIFLYEIMQLPLN